MESPFTAYQGDDPYVFVSYSHEDAAAVYPQLIWLRDQGINVWYDEGISPGSRWSEALADSLKNATVVLYFVTPNSVASRHCLDEINFALDNETPTLTVFLEDTELTPGLQLRLSSHQAIVAHELGSDAYRNKLMTTMTTLLGGTASVASTATIETAPVAAGRSPLTWIVGVVGLVVLVAVGLWMFRDEPAPGVEAVNIPVVDETQTPEDSRPSIAILPFDNYSPSEDNAFFAAGIHDDILSALSKIDGLKVISRTSVMAYKDREVASAVVADELGVGHIMEGSVRRAGNQVRISVQLIDALGDEQLWSETFDRDLADIFAVQSEVAQRITDELKVALSVDVLERIRNAPTDNMVAYDLYLRGRGKGS